MADCHDGTQHMLHFITMLAPTNSKYQKPELLPKKYIIKGTTAYLVKTLGKYSSIVGIQSPHRAVMHIQQKSAAFRANTNLRRFVSPGTAIRVDFTYKLLNR